MTKDTSTHDDNQFAAMANACVCANFRKASRAVTQLYDEILHPLGIRSTQLTILVEIAAAKSANVSRMSRRLVMAPSTVTRNLNPLLKQNLIVVDKGKNARSKEFRVTSEGYDLLTQAEPLWRKAQDSFIEQLGRSEWDNLTKELAAAVTIAKGTSLYL